MIFITNMSDTNKIKYKIIYNKFNKEDISSSTKSINSLSTLNSNANSDNEYIELDDTILKGKFNEFKNILKELLEKRDKVSKNNYIDKLLEIVKMDAIDTNEKIFTVKNLPFILSIEKENGDKKENILVILNNPQESNNVFIDFWNTNNESIDFGIFRDFNIEYYSTNCKKDTVVDNTNITVVDNANKKDAAVVASKNVAVDADNKAVDADNTNVASKNVASENVAVDDNTKDAAVVASKNVAVDAASKNVAVDNEYLDDYQGSNLNERMA